MSLDSEILVTVENVSKKFCRSLKKSLWYGVTDVASAINPFAGASEALPKRSISPSSSAPCPSDLAKPLPALRPDEFWAVQNVSFQLRRGECLGLIGHNGAGKSTLLKVLHGLIPPDTGRITMKGRVAALIELNAGFNPILSGRENIFNQAALLGFSKNETLAKLDSIVQFAEIGDFLDMPVQNYSSGMRVRLGFAVAAQMDPDVLIIDEVLAVGDVGFRFKCMNRIREMLKTSACIFVSHAMPQVANICSRVIHLRHGVPILNTTKIDEAMNSYYGEFDTSEQSEAGTLDVRAISTTVRTLKAGSEFSSLAEIAYNDALEIRIVCSFIPSCHEATIHFVVYNQDMYPVIDVQSPCPAGRMQRFLIRPGAGRLVGVRSILKNIQLNSGRYSLSVILLSPDGSTVHSRLDRAAEFSVISNSGSACSITSLAEWELDLSHD